MSERENESIRGGFQENGSYIQQITRQTKGSDGTKGWHPPQDGQRIITRKGPFKVNKSEVLYIEGRPYFRASGKLVDSDK